MIILIGIMATILTSSFDIPQIIKIYKNKNVESISGISLILKLIMLILWFIYAILDGDVFLLITNSLCLIWSIILIIFFIKYDEHKSTRTNSKFDVLKS